MTGNDGTWVPSVSVIVPVYNVGPYLRPCLDSLANQTLDDVEIVLVDDGSSDGSEKLCDEFAAEHEHVEVLHVDNGGLGRARNIGVEHTTGEYIAFCDSDDVVPLDAYERMYRTVSSTGSDIATGNVMRWTGTRLWPSGLHQDVFRRSLMATTMRRFPQLLSDTTAWNKIYRRAFWLEHGFRFPEGVLYEDIPVTIPAHYLARSIDVLAEPVYWWRERQDGSLSITQRRTELSNLEDRVSAVQSVNRFLMDQHDDFLKERHDRKVLQLDLNLFMRDLPDGDEPFRKRFMELAGEYVATTSEAVLERLAPFERLKYYLVRAGMLDELVEVIDFQRGGGALPVRRKGLKLVADLPLSRRDAIPAKALNLSRAMPVRQGIGPISWDGHDLVLAGHAYIETLPFSTPASGIRRLVLREDEGGRRIIKVMPRPSHSPDVTASVRTRRSLDWAGFRAQIDARKLLPKSGDETTWEAVIQVMTPWAGRGSRVGPPKNASGFFPARQSVDGFLVTPFYDEDKWLLLSVRRENAVVRRAEALDGTLAVEGDLAGEPSAWQDAVLRLRAHDAAVVDLPVELSAGPAGRTGFRATVPASEVVAAHIAVAEVRWDLSVVTPAGESTPVLAAPGLRGVARSHGARELLLRADRRGEAVLIDHPPRVVATGLVWEAPGVLRVTATSTLPPEHVVQIDLVHALGRRVTGQVTQSADDAQRLEVVFDVARVPGPLGARPVEPGVWRVMLVDADAHGRAADQQLGVDVAAARGIEAQTVTEPTIIRPRVSGQERLWLHVLALPDELRGPRHQLELQRTHYRLQRRRKIRDLVLLESWQGKQYSDSPKAIAEEVARRGGPEQLWVVRDPSVPVPEGAATVVKHSREYYSALARARWVVSNDSLPPFYVKRPGTTYVQTWHGTPLKRIAFDMDKIHFKNKNYLNEFALEVKKWDFLVSPNAYSTEILRRAFRFDGEIIESGYPRNDIFYTDESAAVRSRVRSWLGLAEDKRVVLWAPTWRDNAFDTGGRYQFPLTLDLARMAEALGDDTVLLFRGHHLVSDTIDRAALGSDFVRDVTSYPDIGDLYLAADVLITDYSSVMFDFANTGRPMLFYTWDLDTYRDVLRGFYFDFEADAPGPLLRTTDEVIASLRDLDEVTAESSERYKRFVQRFCSLEDGHAAARVVDRVFGQGT